MSQMDDYGRHEVLHMAAYFERAIDEELCDHEQIKSNPEWLALAEKACESLAELYQAISAVHMDEFAEKIAK